MNNLQIAKKLLKEISSYNYEAYIVGGAVRDYLLGIDVYDVDIATSMPLELIKDRFTVIDNGSEYLSVTIEYDGAYFETTNFRKDIEYKNHRHPIVEIVDSFLVDSNRRDFTINALAMDYNGKIIDYHNGLNDLNNKIIKTINNPNDRFEEDALRILRALYLSSKLNFNIEEHTLQGMINKKHLLSSLSDERIYSYLIRILNCPYTKGIDFINGYNLFEFIPVYNKLINIYNRKLSELVIYCYYVKYREYFPIITAKEKRVCKDLEILLESNFSKYSLYIYKETFLLTQEVFKEMGYNSDEFLNIINNFPIKKDSDLAVSKEELAQGFEGKNKSLAIAKVLTAILEGNIKNTKEDIYNLLNRGL